MVNDEPLSTTPAAQVQQESSSITSVSSPMSVSANTGETNRSDANTNRVKNLTLRAKIMVFLLILLEIKMPKA